MTIDPKTLPAEVVVECVGGAHPHYRDPSCDSRIERVFVPVPDGMTVEDATQALADHVQWAPLPDGVQERHIGARLRCVFETVATEGRSTRASGTGVWAGSNRIGMGLAGEDWFIHPDDVPTDPDPDAELIEDMANRLVQIDSRARLNHADVMNISRELLAVVREHEAGAR